MKGVVLLIAVMLGAAYALGALLRTTHELQDHLLLASFVPWTLVSIVSAYHLLGQSCFICGQKKSCRNCGQH